MKGNYVYKIKIFMDKLHARKTSILQDPGTPPARRRWMSIDLGTEIYKDPDQVAEWTVSDFDILVPKQ